MPRASALKPYWQTPKGDVRLWLGDVRRCLGLLPAKSVHCTVTSPPYWGLRSYLKNHHPDKQFELGNEPSPDCRTNGQAQCGRCFVCAMVSVFRGVHRVLRDDGTLWLNLGDSYNANTGAGFNGNAKRPIEARKTLVKGGLKEAGLKAGNLVGAPWRVALALQTDGWTLRQDIIWSKPSPMPESARDRCTKSHEYLFMLTKQRRYYYDDIAIREVATNKYPFRIKRSVWTIVSESYPGAHFATFPRDLVRPCILAGTSAHGCCVACGSPYRRVVEFQRSNSRLSGGGNCIGKQRHSVEGTGAQQTTNYKQIIGETTLGWNRTCDCADDRVSPAIVLDPFAGSFTTGAVAVELGRQAWGIDLSEQYLRKNAIPRVGAALIKRDGGHVWHREKIATTVQMG